MEGRFFDRHDTYLFLRDHKYWLMTHWDVLDLDRVDDYVLNRGPPILRPARLHHSQGRHRET